MHYKITCQCGHALTINQQYFSDYSNYQVIEVLPHKCTERPPAPSIDHLVEDNKQTLIDLHNKFLKWDDVEKHWMCTCPICSSLEKGGDCQT